MKTEAGEKNADRTSVAKMLTGFEPCQHLFALIKAQSLPGTMNGASQLSIIKAADDGYIIISLQHQR